ncbi:MAG TPA: carboxypeptidase regulatory-like domain-containing protein [Acidobacteriaceae bacterium]|nr:carboxypeptidase regulatory-like domain-containing protein [Acidobacteriaceae bacterium]
MSLDLRPTLRDYKRKFSGSVALLLLLLLATTLPAAAQQFASLTITAQDPSGAAIANAQVAIRNAATGVEKTSVSDAAGIATIPGLAAGAYTLSVKASGFADFHAPLTFTLGQELRFNVTLQVGRANATIEVNDIQNNVSGEQTQSSQVIAPQQITQLPIAERDFIDFVLLTPTATIGRSTSTAAQSAFQETELMISIGGLRETHSIFYGLDGVDYNTSTSGVQRVSPSLDWVDEFRVTTTPTAAEAGMNMGAAVNTITKSGANDLHGSLYDYARNNQFDAKNLLAAPGFSALRFNQFGTTLGGPIRRDKVFFFGGYQGQRRAESPIFSRFILNCIDTEGCLGPGTPSINEVKQGLGLAPENLGSILLIQDYDNAFAKLTAAPNSRTSLAIGYLYANVRNHNTAAASPGQGLPSSYRDNLIHDQTLYGNYFRQLNTAWTSESQLSFGRRIFNMNPVGAGYEPAIQVSDELYSGGFLGGVSYYGEHYFEARETLSRTHDRNTLRFGAEFQPIWFEATTPYFTPGVAIFSPQSFFGVGPFAPGGPFGPGTAVEFLFHQPRSEFGAQVPQRELPFETGFYTGADADLRRSADQVHFWHRLFNLYAEDQWHALPNLMLTAGVRWDVDLLPTAADLQIIGNMTSRDYSKIQPRLGAAWAFRNNRSVLRANFGLYTGSFEYSSMVNNWHGASPFTAMNQPLLPQFANPDKDLIGFAPEGMVGAVGPGAAGAAFRAFAGTGTYPAPASLKQFPLGFMSRKFPKLYSEKGSLELDNDLGSKWHATLNYTYIHSIHLNSSSSVNGLPAGLLSDGRQKFAPADPNFGFVLFDTASGWAIYNAGTASLRRDLANHFSLTAAYTYGKSIDIATEGQLQDEPQDYLNPKLDRAVGDNDVRHRLVLTQTADSPSTWPAPLRNIGLSMLHTLQSGQYYNILAGSDINGDSFPFNDRVGDISRNTYRGASYYNTDLRLQRTFHLNDQLHLEARAEALNLLNRVNVQDVDQVYGAGEFSGPVPQHYGDGITSSANPTFGTPTFAGPARQFQFSFKLTY